MDMLGKGQCIIIIAICSRWDGSYTEYVQSMYGHVSRGILYKVVQIIKSGHFCYILNIFFLTNFTIVKDLSHLGFLLTDNTVFFKKIYT